MRCVGRIGSALVLVTVAAACANVAEINSRSTELLRPRAAFDMQCGEKDLVFKALVDHDPHFLEGVVTQWGVEGCEKRVVYVRTPVGWVANTADVKDK